MPRAFSQREFKSVSLVFLLLAGFFLIFPQVDLAVSAQFYLGGGNWPSLDNQPVLQAVYQGVPRLGQALLLVLLGLWAWGLLTHWRGLQPKRRLIVFLLSAALIGPVLMVDVALKGYGGRARPLQVEEFGGQRRFTAAFVPSDQCNWNCSFVSGHVATVSFIMAWGWLGGAARRRRYLQLSLLAAAGMACLRLSVGGHFLSDTVFAWFATYFGTCLTEVLLRRWVWGDSGRD